MTHSDFEEDEKPSGGKSALPDLPPAVRYEQQSAAAPSDDLDDEELNDTTTTLHGAKAIIGKATYAANQAGRSSDQSSSQQARDEEHEVEEREMRELMHLAAWNAQMTNVGGVEMTNEQAQKARQHIIDNVDEYADRAVREGRITADEKEEYMRVTKRIHELKDKEGRGTANAEDRRECERLQKSEAGRASEHDAGEFHKQQERNADAKTTARNDYSKLKGDIASSVYGDAFQDTPRATPAFTAAASPAQAAPEAEKVIAPPSPKAAAMGVGI